MASPAMDDNPGLEHRNSADECSSGTSYDLSEGFPLGLAEDDCDDCRGIYRNQRGNPQSSHSIGSGRSTSGIRSIWAKIASKCCQASPPSSSACRSVNMRSTAFSTAAVLLIPSARASASIF